MKITVKGLDELIKQLNAVDLERALTEGLEESAEYTLDKLKQNTPVDTGNLRDSNEKKINTVDYTAEIGPNIIKAPYAFWVDQGHHTRSGSFVDGQFYIQRTILQVRDPVNLIFQKVIKSAVNKSN